MRTLPRIFILFFSLFMLFSCGEQTTKFNTKRVIIIALDGISVEGFHAAHHPNLDKLIGEGVISLSTRNVMPSVTLPNWTSHLTGSGPEQHGVVNNKWELDNHALPPVANDSKGYYPSIFKILKDQVPSVKTAFYYNWAKLIEPYNQDYIDEPSYEADAGYLTNYEKAFRFLTENRDNPAFVFLYTVHTDFAGHAHGWMSPEYIASIEEADVAIGEFLEKLKDEGLYESSHIMFLSDHGGVGKGHGGISVTEMEVPWTLTGPGIKSGLEFSEPNNTMNTAAVIAHLFGCEVPLAWIGQVPEVIFK